MIRETAAGVTLAIRAQPGAKKTAITGTYGEGPDAQLKIAVHAAPLEGRANQALIEFLAGFFSLSRTSVVLQSGQSSRSKVILLQGATRAAVESLLRESL